MGWSEVQQARLQVEKGILDTYFPGRVTWIDPTGNTKVEVLIASNSEKQYKLRIYIPTDFPNSCPKLVVVSPRELLRKDGQPLPTMSNPFHTLKIYDGFQTICHFYPKWWTDDLTLYQVFMKGRFWVEAYEGHLDTGRDLDVFLCHQTRGEESRVRSNASQTRSNISQTRNDASRTRSDTSQTRSDTSQTRSDTSQTRSNASRTRQYPDHTPSSELPVGIVGSGDISSLGRNLSRRIDPCQPPPNTGQSALYHLTDERWLPTQRSTRRY